MYYVYHLIDPITNTPFYVGKGHGNRMFYHELQVKRNKIPNKNNYLFNKIKKILSLKLDIIYKKVYENLTEKDAFNRECEEIKKYEIKRVGGILCNLSYGGEGMKGYKFTNLQLKKHKKRMKEVHSKPTAKLQNSKSITKFYNDHPEQKQKLSNIQKRLWKDGKYDNSKEWTFVSPDGNALTFKNLQQFCINNDLQQSNMINVYKGKRKSHKGWTKLYL